MVNKWPFNLPKLPDFEDRLPFIWRQFVDHCDAPVTIWLQALGPAVVHALINWWYVDLIQILRTMWTPPVIGWRARATGHGAKHEHARRRGWRRVAGKIVDFDPNAIVGKALNPFDGLEPFVLSEGELWFLTLEEAVVVVAFYWSILDIGSGFLYEWTSAVAKTKYCHARDDAVLYASAAGWVELGIFGWDAFGFLDSVKMRNIEFWNGYGVEQAVGPGIISIMFTWQCIDPLTPGPWIEYRLHCLTGPRQGTYAFAHTDTMFNGTGSGAASYDIQTGETWIGEIRVNGSFNILEPALYAHANGFRPT